MSPGAGLAISRAIAIGGRAIVSTGSKAVRSKGLKGTLVVLRQLSRVLDSIEATVCARTQNKNCDVDIPTFFSGRFHFTSGGLHGKVTEHIADAIESGVTPILHKNSATHDGWYAKDPRCIDASQASGKDCDEYPFNSTIENRQLRPHGVSLRPINLSQNRSHGNALKRFYEACGLPDHDVDSDGSTFAVIPVVSSPVTFWRCGRD